MWIGQWEAIKITILFPLPFQETIFGRFTRWMRFVCSHPHSQSTWCLSFVTASHKLWCTRPSNLFSVPSRSSSTGIRSTPSRWTSPNRSITRIRPTPSWRTCPDKPIPRIWTTSKWLFAATTSSRSSGFTRSRCQSPISTTSRRCSWIWPTTSWWTRTDCSIARIRTTASPWCSKWTISSTTIRFSIWNTNTLDKSQSLSYCYYYFNMLLIGDHLIKLNRTILFHWSFFSMKS